MIEEALSARLDDTLETGSLEYNHWKSVLTFPPQAENDEGH
jgi:hypothetical protein